MTAKDILERIENNPGFLEDELSQVVSSETHFGAEVPKMYYFVREPSKVGASNEGFAEHMIIESELHNGRICVDGSIYENINYGDKLIAEVRPENRLKCIKFIM